MLKATAIKSFSISYEKKGPCHNNESSPFLFFIIIYFLLKSLILLMKNSIHGHVKKISNKVIFSQM